MSVHGSRRMSARGGQSGPSRLASSSRPMPPTGWRRSRSRTEGSRPYVPCGTVSGRDRTRPSTCTRRSSRSRILERWSGSRFATASHVLSTSGTCGSSSSRRRADAAPSRSGPSAPGTRCHTINRDGRDPRPLPPPHKTYRGRQPPRSNAPARSSAAVGHSRAVANNHFLWAREDLPTIPWVTTPFHVVRVHGLLLCCSVHQFGRPRSLSDSYTDTDKIFTVPIALLVDRVSNWIAP